MKPRQKQPSQKRRHGRRPAFSRGGKLNIIPLGGNEEVGRNMTVFEYGNDIILLDMGLQFPEEDMPGMSSSGNCKPMSTIIISPSYSNTVMLRPTSSSPPKTMIFNLLSAGE